MLPLPRGAVWQLLFLFCAALYINGVRSEGRVVCYYTNWSVYRPGTAKFNPQNINPYLCTHLIYAFGGFTKDNQMKPFDKYQDIEQGGYAKFTGLKTYNKQLKTMIAIGGWNEASSRFSPLVAAPERRQKFIKNILKFLRQNHFDGIDLDWEYPAHREGGKSRDRDNYAQFVQELRAEFEREAEKTGRPRLLVTMAVPAGIEYIEKGYDIPKLNKYLDWFNVLTYDFHSSHEPSVNHHAPLYSLEEESEYNYDGELNIDYSIKFYLNAGADKDKLVLGIPTYGRSFTLINEESTEIGAPAEAPGDQGDATREKGYLAYYEICQNLKEDPEWTVVQPNPNAMGPYAYRRNQWVGYDDEAIVRKKAQYVVDNGLGGIMFWAIDNDDFRGTCSGKPYPLIEAAKDAMLEALGLGINEVSKPSAPQKPSRSRSRENSSSTRNRITTSEQKLTYAERKGSNKRTQTTQQSTRKVQSTTSEPLDVKLTAEEVSSLYIGGRTTTPPPPTTPDPGTDFKCEEEGFFQHPRDCKKYYWCLDSGPSGLGIVAHQFTCPSGLYFNPAADSCDFARNVPCKIKKSTTAAPITSASTTTTTTVRPTAALNRLTSAPSRPSLFRTTSTTSTTTTTEAPEEEVEYEEDEDNVPSPFAKNKGLEKEAEEDPQVIKELIELIRKVGGIEELEKHLLRKDDGTISIKENSSSSSSSLTANTTPTPISKSLYEKVLSKPNALNSFRNRFTSTSSFRNTQTKTEIKAQDETVEDEEEEKSNETDTKTSGASAGAYSKYSSVLRGNSRQGPQNEGIEKITEFEGFQKEKKQYTTINRNRGVKKASDVEEDEEEESVISKTNIEETHEDDEDEVVVRTTKRPVTSATPSYSTIRRTRPSTSTTEAAEEVEEEHEEKEEKEEKEVTGKKSYQSLNRSRVRGTTTTELPEVTEVTAGTTRYKYLERTRPTRPTTESSNTLNAEEDEDEESEDHENTVHIKANDNTRETQQQQEITTTINTQRTYASIGRRTTTATPETETTTNAAKTTSTTETPITTPLTNIETTTTTTPESIILSTNIPIATTTNPITISTTTITSTKTTTLPNGEEVLESLLTNTTPYPNDIDTDNETLKLSLNINSLLTENDSSSTLSFPTTESGLDTNKQESDSELTTTTTETTSTATTEANDIKSTSEDLESKNEEVNLVSKQRNKTLYTTRTRTTTTTPQTTSTTTNSDIETTSSPTTNTKKPLGVRRQQLLLNRSSQTKTTTATSTTTDIPTPSTESVNNNNNDFLGTVSSPRPFGFPKRRTRPTAGTSSVSTTTEEIVKPNDESLVTKQKTTKLNAAVTNTKTKVSSHNNTILSQTATQLETETSSQQEHEHATQPEESEVTTHGTEEHVFDKHDTKVEHIKKHVVVQVDGFEGINNNDDNTNLRHVNIVDNSNSNLNNAHKIRTHTIVEEVDDDEDNGPHKSYSWRDARRPTKPTPKKKKLIVTEVTTEERLKQRVSPDHVTIVNEVENNAKDIRFNRKEENTGKFSGKYRGKSLENTVEDGTHLDNEVEEQVGAEEDEEGRAFRTYTTINRRRNQNKQFTGIGEDELALNDFKVTQVVRSGGEEVDEKVDEVEKTKHRYSTFNRGQSTQETSATEEENDTTLKLSHNKQTQEDSEINNNHKIEANDSDDESSLKTKFKYTSITRGQSTKTTTENVDSNSGNAKANTEEDTETENSQSDGSSLKSKFKYTSITQGQSTENSENEQNSKTKEDSEIESTETNNTQENNDSQESVSKTKFKYTTITRRGQTTKAEESDSESLTNHDAENSSTNAESNDTDDQTTNRFKYTKITRTQTTENAGNEDLANYNGNDDAQTTRFKYTKVTRGQAAQKNTEDDSDNLTFKINQGGQTQQETDNSHFGLSDQKTEKKSYTTITRTRGSTKNNQESGNSEDSNENSNGFRSSTIYVSNTENIPYKAIVRGSEGVRLADEELSGFIKGSAGHSITTTEENSKRTYQTISRGGQINQGLSNEDETTLENSKIHEMEAMSLTNVEEEVKENQFNDNVEDEDLTAEIDDNQSSTTETESSTTTTTEEPTTTSTTTEATTTSTTTDATTTTTEEPSSTTEEELASSTEEVTPESSTEFVTPETVTQRILFRNRASSTTPEPTTRKSLLRNRVSTTDEAENDIEVSTRRTLFRARSTTQAPEEVTTTQTTSDEPENDVEVSTRRTLFRTRSSTQAPEEVTTTQTTRRRTVLRRRPTSSTTEAAIKEEAQDVVNETETKKTSQSTDESSGNTQTTTFRRRTVLRRKPTTIEHTLIENQEAQQKFDRDSLIQKASEATIEDTSSTSHQTLSRGSYRPSEKGDLSSLLALDLSKKYGNKSPQTFGIGKRRRPVEKSSTEADTEDSNHTETDVTETLITDNESSLTADNLSSTTGVKGDSEILTETTSTQTLSRGSYRPSEKGDLSSLLALDLSKKYGSNTQHTFGNSIRRRPTPSSNGVETEDGTEKRVHINDSTNEQSSTVTETLNGRRKTIIRKRIQTNKTTGTESSQGLLDADVAKTTGRDSLNSETEVKTTIINDTETSKNSASSSNSSDNQETLTNGNKSITSENSLISSNIELSETSENTLKITDADLSKTSENTLTSSDDKLSKTSENSSGSASDELSKTLSDSSSQTHTEDSDNSESHKIKTNALGTDRTKAFNSQNHKYAFANKRVTENQNSKTQEVEKETTETTSDSSDSTDSQNDRNSEDNNISSTTGSKYQSRNTLNLQNQEYSRKSAFSSRRGGSHNSRVKNNHGKTEEIETLDDGTTRIKTTHTETINTGGNTVKTIKRTKTKTIVKQAPEYEYETEDIPVTTTTRRTITRNRGSARFESNDLSSLLALDFASKSNRKTQGDQTASKSRRKLIRKPDIITEEEHVEEYEEELATRPPRPSTTTEAPEPTSRRTRPTRPLRTTTTRAPQIEQENEEVNDVVNEDVVSTTRRNFAFKRPNSVTKSTTQASVIEEDNEEIEESTTRRNVGFRRPTATKRTSTTEKPTKTSVIETEQENETVERTSTKVVNRFKFKQPIPTTTKEPTTVKPTTAEPTTESTTTESTTTESTTTESTTTESTTAFVELISSTEEPTTSTTPETTTTESAPSSTDASTTESTTEVVSTHDPLDLLKNQLASAVRKLKTETEIVEKVTETEVSDAVDMKTKITADEEDLSLPIYHRRKYYQYYKDSPIIHVNPITVAPNSAPQTNVDIAKQIHDVFNISNNHLNDPEVSEEDTEALLAMEQAKEINSELGNFLLNTPGSK